LQSGPQITIVFHSKIYAKHICQGRDVFGIESAGSNWRELDGGVESVGLNRPALKRALESGPICGVE